MASTAAFFFSPKRHELELVGFDKTNQRCNASGPTPIKLGITIENRSSKEHACGPRQPQERTKTNGSCD
jgi:hypothetical protein